MQKTIYSRPYKELISWLKQSRESKGISMRELAHNLNVSHSWVSKVENLERRLDVYEYSILCKQLGVDPKNGLGKLDI